MFRESLKDWLAILQSLATISALLFGGIWFVDQQSLKKELKVENAVTERKLAGRPDVWLISVEVNVTNTGKVRETASGGRLRILQKNPLPERLIFPEEDLDPVELDPGETDQAHFRVYKVSSKVQTIEIYANYPVPDRPRFSSLWPFDHSESKDSLNWDRDSIFDLSQPRK